MKQSPWQGYSIAPFTGPLLYGIIILFFPATYDNKEFSAAAWFISVSIFIITSYLACFLVGAPLIILLKKYKKLTFSWLAITGSCLYALIINVILFIAMQPTITGKLYIIILKTILTGFAMGLLIITVYSYLTGIIRRNS